MAPVVPTGEVGLAGELATAETGLAGEACVVAVTWAWTPPTTAG
ncbi:MAG: hypothetical protein ACT4OP_12835 [Actinomycetota bacterium]